ncbi:hypothetical protein [Mycobacteroides abscessus]|uniref:hypothetical protein n=1 Tax=Mycobacteroides abscessus TaxID=36809 RepID=UPI0009D0C78A|nr:hypothetical protein [Mycobacteroides abscessus]SLB64704.1 Uncharacterised protein [Mycobacteroides abscessus subsp. abscessus]
MSPNENKPQEDPYHELASAIFEGLDALYKPAMAAIRKASDPSRGLVAIECATPAKHDFEIVLRELEEKLTKIAERNGYHHEYSDVYPDPHQSA